MSCCFGGGFKAESPLPMGGRILESHNLKIFSFNELKAATKNFSTRCLLGGGGFGSVYKGWINEHLLIASTPESGIAIAVKMLNRVGLEGQQEWLAEIKYLGLLNHPNLVHLIGYCTEDEHRLLVYEFMPKGSLENHLFKRDSFYQPLSWNLRMKIALGAAKGLAFLHNEAHVIHRDFNSSNILLDVNYNAKLSDFGLATDGPLGNATHVTTRIMGTYGYSAPEYAMSGHLTTKSEVYSFGVVLLEMLSGRRAIDFSKRPGEQKLVECAGPYLRSKRKVFEILDPLIDGQHLSTKVLKAAHLASRCLAEKASCRPDMDEVVKELEFLYDRDDEVLPSILEKLGTR